MPRENKHRFKGDPQGQHAGPAGGGLHEVGPGLINIIKNKEKLKIFPIVNWKF